MAVTLPVASTRRWWRPVPVLDVGLAVLLGAYAVAASAREVDASHPLTETVAAIVGGALVVRTRAPLLMGALAAAGFTGYALLPGSGTPLWTFLAVLIVGFSLGAELTGGRRWVDLGLLLASAYALQLASLDRQSASDNTFTEVWISPLVIVGGPALAGALLQRARRQTAELRRLTAELEVERERHARAAAAAERNRIARELHDVIAHAVTVMVVQAGAAEQQLSDDAPARGPIRAIREAGKDALGELRRQLGALRDGDPTAPAALPGLADLPRLVQRADARLVAPVPDDADVPPGLALTVYRVVQEALTNAQRHAPEASITVAVSRRADVIEVVVVDDGPGASTAHGSGRGLLGMRERVEMYGGRLEAGPREGTGWQVRARLPAPGATW